ncbi:MAG: Abi family protein [Bacilli bacterium]|nr:Abi family protein [Bacilli bacterium]MBQ9854524.1 Abi family protein [Bacilli bacterium]
MKEYKNSNELLDYIISKGVSVNNKEDALYKIKTYSYYSIINTYKDVFKNTNNEYKKNVSFDEIYALFEFDKNLRSIFLKYSLEIEMILKSLLAETISSRYGIKDYLIKENFDDIVNKATITESINVIEEEINKQNGKHEAVTHYIDEYGFVPPFVLTKILTLGELSRLYAMLKQSDRQSISKNFKLSDRVLKQIIVNMTMIRNICAHNDRLFSFHSKFRISFKYIEKNYNEKSVNIYMIMKCMESLLPKDQKKDFVKLINIEIKQLNSKLKSIKIDNILNIMGFYKNN